MARFQEHFGVSGIKKYATNTGWYFLQKIITLPVSILTLVVVTRYLGPEQFGIWSYALSLVSITGLFASLGIDDIVFRDIAARTKDDRRILGAAFLIKFFGGLASFFVSVLVVYVLDTEPLIRAMVAIMAISFLFQPFQILRTYFQAKVQAKYVALVVSLVFFIASILKILFAILGLGLLYFASISLIESILYALLFWIMYKLRKGSVRTWIASWSTIRSMLLSSWPLALSAVSGIIYARIDQVFLMQMVDETAVGLYSAGIRIAEYWFLIPALVATSLFPAIVMMRSHSRSKYLDRTVELTLLLLGITLAGAIGMTLLGHYVITFLFGVAYAEAADILIIYAWTGLGVAFNIALQKYLITEDATSLIFICNVFSMLTNVALNLLLIPTYGMYGAAFATLISYSLLPFPVLFSRTHRETLRYALVTYAQKATARARG